MSKPWIANAPEDFVCEKWKGEPNTVCVSITEPGRTAALPDVFDALLRLEFHDYDSERKHPASAVLFTSAQAGLLSAFAEAHRGKNFMVHCAAGVSRSGAVVEVLLEAFPEYEDAGSIRYPNGHVKRLLKRALGMVPLGANANS